MRNGLFSRQALAPLLLGMVSFFLVIGPNVLDPGNIAWLDSGDRAQHFLGWHFFRSSDWAFPPGLSPEFGIELSNSVVYSDSNPLLALLFKPFSNFLPEVFQYFGLWLLACFILQAWFGWRLLGFISNNGIVRLLGAGFFVFSPPMIFRASVHLSLAGHFLVLAALYLALKPKVDRRGLLWAVLLSVSALVHAYLLAMVAFIWLADLVGRLVIERRPVLEAVLEVIVMAVVLGLVCWSAGYFSVGQGVVSGGYGYFRMNLLSILDANGWSFALKSIPRAESNSEGFNFLGLGGVVLALWSIPVLVSGRINIWPVLRRRVVLLLMLLGLTLFSLSNDVGISNTGFQYPLPELVLRAANIFRASGRMFWPVFYMLVFVLLFVVIRGYGTRPAIVVLAGALVLQVVDTRAGWGDIRTNLMAEPAAEWSTSLDDPFWTDAARQYKKIRWLLPANQSPNWQVLAAFAAKHHMATDAVYLARISPSALKDAQSRALDTLRSGHYEADTLYILDETSLHLAVHSLNAESDLLARVDGLFVVAPGWKRCEFCARGQDEIRPADLQSIVYLGKDLPSTTGAVNGSSRLARAGLNQPGFITYGPYIHLPKGAYEVSIKYTSSAPDAFRIGRYDVYDAGRQHQDAEGVLYGTGGEEKLLTAYFEIGDQPLSPYEFRVFWEGISNLEVHEVRLRGF
ncbi:DUF6311 domain-containing protein [Azotobacter beijerinckii]|uniref:4-amino-4-deoxy-L-arabinose transferase n=1 Tax=Azotobacter beijerinckii TaxID=170623 RepID=A0A1I3ZVX5_9GAMM|nr:DUF6311 domain-containing protein [Azotobacter beijerinckii]SFA85251.1 hypothetical protein SAMN04244571_00575 [Azotobacter beijerinckii]SFK47861.1 hypothetical protein SAMN04244574_00759 [Azotobacter beijerinckii]